MEKLNKYLLKNGTITNRQARLIGIGRHTLAHLAKKGVLERLKNGVYKRKDDILDEFFLIGSNSNRVVFSYQTALYLHDLSDRVPNVFHISVPQGYNASHLKTRFKHLRVHYIKKECFEIGITEVVSPLGNQIKSYDKERCICDIIIARQRIDKQIFSDAMIGYFKGENKKMRNLIKYSRQLNVEQEVRKYIEVLL